jgi:F0F1-type ATP synthase assembly protein I
MKKVIIGAIVGGLIIFIWQFLSFAAINFHQPAQQYTEKQDAILNFLSSQGLEDGGYYMPGVPEGTSEEEFKKAMEQAGGKPWAMIQYHNKQADNVAQQMMMNMVRGFLINVIIMFLFISILRRMNRPTFGQILSTALMVGLIVFLNAPYTNHIWYKTFDIWAHLLDAVVAWGLAGAWLGWWLRTSPRPLQQVREGEKAYAQQGLV